MWRIFISLTDREQSLPDAILLRKAAEWIEQSIKVSIHN